MKNFPMPLPPVRSSFRMYSLATAPSPWDQSLPVSGLCDGGLPPDAP